MFISIEYKLRKKCAIHNNKLRKLGCFANKEIVPTKVINIVENHSSEVFNEKQINLLNHGLKFALRSSQSEVEEVITGIESSIQRVSEPTKHFVREACRQIMSKNIEKNSHTFVNHDNKQVIKSLREKDCFYLKADKGNKVVILDRTDYFDRVKHLIDNGPYKVLGKNPLPSMVRSVNTAMKSSNNLITSQLKLKLHVSNPVVPKLYCLPKIHKPGKSMRPIVSAINAPTCKLSKWLTNEFNKLPSKQPSFSVQNSLEFINQIKDVKLQPGELLVSFDVSSLFPSVPIPQTLAYLEDLLVQNNLDPQIIQEYIQLTKLCMKQNIFQFNGSFYEQHEGTAMGNSLSPFIADLFMSRLEKDLENELEYFPRVWLRYVDDIFAIFDTNKCHLDDFLVILNNRFDSIKFTFEKESNSQLPFLDTLVIRNKDSLEFDVFRKDTSTLRYITSDSHHCPQHKMASLNFLVHRLLNFPLSKERYNKELRTIYDAARCNGYDTKHIKNIIRKVNHKKFLNECSTFRKDKPQGTSFVTIPYAPQLTRGFDKIFRDLDMKVVYTSGSSLQSFLGNPKDKVGPNEKSGIYEITCKNCDQKYIGQTKRSILTRFKEHMAHLRYSRFEKSSVAQHIFEKDHVIDSSCLKLVKPVSNCKFLDILECLEIQKNKNCIMNGDLGPIPFSSLFKLLGTELR